MNPEEVEEASELLAEILDRCEESSGPLVQALCLFYALVHLHEQTGVHEPLREFLCGLCDEYEAAKRENAN